MRNEFLAEAEVEQEYMSSLVSRLAGKLSISESSLPERALVDKVLVLLGLVVALCIVMTSLLWDVLEPHPYLTGDIAQHTVRSPRNLLVEDTLRTAQKRSEAARAVPRVFVLLDGHDMLPSRRIAAFFAALREIANERGNGAPLTVAKEKRVELEHRFNLDLVGEEWDVILNTANWPALEAAVTPLSTPVVKKGIAPD